MAPGVLVAELEHDRQPWKGGRVPAPAAPPALVARAVELARRVGFPLTREEAESAGGGPSCSLPEIGRLLATLVASRPGGRIAEVGTGVGVGAAWMASGLAGGATLLTVEFDPERAAAAAALFEEHEDVTVLAGDARRLLPPMGPFDLVFADGGYGYGEDLVELVAVGGLLVLDDLTPEEQRNEATRAAPDPKRDLVFGSPRLLGVELRTTPTDGALLATRTR